MSLMADYSDNERDTVRSAAFGAILLVSKADPGFFATFKESMAGSKVLAKASPELREMLTGMPKPPMGNPEEIDEKVLTSLKQAVAILQQKGTDEVEGFKALIVEACNNVAEASKGVAPAETEAIGKVQSALGVS
jgi:hypothetical protein